MDKREKKMDKNSVQGLMEFRRRGYYLKNKKGKGSYDRKNFHRDDDDDGYYFDDDEDYDDEE